MAERRGHKEGGITKRYSRDGRLLGYQVQVKLPTGIRKTLGTTKRYREAVKLAQRGQVELAAGRLTTSPRQTLDTYLTAWLASKRPSLRYKTYVTYQTVIRHACARIGRMRLDAIKAKDIEDCERDLGSATGARTVQQMHMVLRQALDRAVKLDMIGRNPADAVEPPRSTTPERPSLSIGQAGTLFSATKNDRFFALYVVLTTTGIRLGEALGLQWDAVDLNDRVLLVRQELQRQTGKGLALEELKTEKSRRPVPLLEVAVEALRSHKAEQNELRLLLGPGWHDTNLVFTSSTGTALDPANVRRHWYAALNDSRLPRVRLHDLRHTATSLMGNEGIELHVIQAVMGHSTSVTTANIYMHVSPASYQEVRDRMDAAFARVV
jgi:integrase